MKQMYKVFINDNQVQFLPEDGKVPADGIQLENQLSSRDIVARVNAPGNNSTVTYYLVCDRPVKRFEHFLEDFPLIRAAGGVVRGQYPQGGLLMIYRHGKWDLPKGKIDPGEEREDAAIREVREECGIRDLKIIKKLPETFHLYELKGSWVAKITYWYLMKSNDKGSLHPQIEEGITEVRWVAEKDVYGILPLAYASISDLLSHGVLNN